MLAHPAFDHRCDRLHGACDVDLALGVADRRDRLAQVDAEPMAVGQAHHAGAVNGAVDVAGETGDERVRLAAAPEEGHVDAVDVVLIDQHGDVAAGLEHAHELGWRVEPGRNKRAHAALADLDDGIAHGADIGPAVEHRGVEPILARDQGGELPVAEMGGEDQRRLSIVAQLAKSIVDRDGVEDVAQVVGVGLEHLQAVDMGEFGRHASEIVPHPVEDGLDLGFGLFGEGGGEIGAAEAMLLEPRAEPAHDAAGEVGHVRAAGGADQAQRADRELPERRVGGRLGVPAGAQRKTFGGGHGALAAARQKVTMILPNTCRLSSRASPRSKSASGTSVSITGSSPLAILARLSRILRMDAPNEPMMRYCCWKSCIKLMVVDGPEVAPQVTSRPPRLRQRSEPLKVSAPTCSNTTSTPFLAVILRTTPSKRSAR